VGPLCLKAKDGKSGSEVCKTVPLFVEICHLGGSEVCKTVPLFVEICHLGGSEVCKTVPLFVEICQLTANRKYNPNFSSGFVVKRRRFSAMDDKIALETSTGIKFCLVRFVWVFSLFSIYL
jgi:hypothetical protein